MKNNKRKGIRKRNNFFKKESITLFIMTQFRTFHKQKMILR